MQAPAATDRSAQRLWEVPEELKDVHPDSIRSLGHSQPGFPWLSDKVWGLWVGCSPSPTHCGAIKQIPQGCRPYLSAACRPGWLSMRTARADYSSHCPTGT